VKAGQLDDSLGGNRPGIALVVGGRLGREKEFAGRIDIRGAGLGRGQEPAGRIPGVGERGNCGRIGVIGAIGEEDEFLEGAQGTDVELGGRDDQAGVACMFLVEGQVVVIAVLADQVQGNVGAALGFEFPILPMKAHAEFQPRPVGGFGSDDRSGFHSAFNDLTLKRGEGEAPEQPTDSEDGDPQMVDAVKQESAGSWGRVGVHDVGWPDLGAG